MAPVSPHRPSLRSDRLVRHLLLASALAGSLLGPAARSAPWPRTLALQGVTFTVTSSGEGSLRQLTVEAREGGKAYPVLRQTIDGSVQNVEVEDLNSDGRPELFVFVQSAGSGSYGSVHAWRASPGRTLSPINFPELSGADAKGYMGHDSFDVVEGTLVRSFPVYRPGDSNARPSGGSRQIDYKLVPGEASWQLRPVRTTAYPAR